MAGRKLRRIAVDAIETPSPRVPLHESTGDLTELKASLETKGQYSPVLVRHHGERYQLVSGFRRLRACRELGRESVLAIVYEEISEDEAEELYVMDNLAGHEVDPRALARLVESRGTESLRSLAVPESLIRPYEGLLKAPESLRQAFYERRISLREAAAMAATGDPTHRAARDLEGDADIRKAEELARRVCGQLEDVMDKLELLEHQRCLLDEPRRVELNQKLYLLDALSRIWRDLTPAAPELEVLGFRHQGGVRRISGETLASEVLEAQAPVLLSLQVKDPESSRRADNALVAIRESYPGELKLCSIDVMETELEAMPQMLRLGREFIFKNLPALLLYWHGRMAGSSTGDVDIERWVRVISAEVSRRVPAES